MEEPPIVWRRMVAFDDNPSIPPGAYSFKPTEEKEPTLEPLPPPPFNYPSDDDEDIRPMELDCKLRRGSSYPDGRSIIVPPDQLFKLVKCNSCDTMDKTETRFEGIYTCVACQWKGLEPLKNPDLFTEEQEQFNAPVQEDTKKSRGEYISKGNDDASLMRGIPGC